MYKSTRGSNKILTASQAMLKGISEDSGLYIPLEIPHFDKPLSSLANMTYEEVAICILKEFFSDFSISELSSCIYNAYKKNFDNSLITPITLVDDCYFLELYHGPTLAFKDIALCLFPYLLQNSIKKLNLKKDIIILTATSGDTGKAALSGFANKENIRIMVFFPLKGVSDIQKLQMITQEGNNSIVVSIDGNFDDAQNNVKKIFNDISFSELLFKNNFILTSANSINIGRLFPQVVYYFFSYGQLIKHKHLLPGEPINIAVPTGNFGNILSAYYSKLMGLPINKFICASNENNVLSDFFNTGIYNKNRSFKITNSPSMDILVSSNLERLLYHLSDNDTSLIKNLMSNLSNKGFFEISSSFKNKLNNFHAGFTTETETLNIINKLYYEFNYLIDTHTAVAYSVYDSYRKIYKDKTKTIIASTAHPFKFPNSICNALNIDISQLNSFEIIEKLSLETNISIPSNIKNLYKKPIVHNLSIPILDMKKTLCDFLQVGD